MEYSFQLKKENLIVNQIQAKKLASKLLNGNYVFLDTETTGTSSFDEIVNLGISNEKGEVLYNNYFKPSIDIKESAAQVSKITNDIVKNKPLFKDEWNKIHKILKGKIIVAYNVDFDIRMLKQTARNCKISNIEINTCTKNCVDAMKIVSMFLGLKSNSYYSIKLEYIAKALGYSKKQLHIAFDDVKMMLYVIKKMANPTVLPSIKSVYDAFPTQTFNKFLYTDGKKEMLCKSIYSSLKESSKEYISKIESIEELSKIISNIEEKENILEIINCFDFFPKDYGDIKKAIFNYIDETSKKEIQIREIIEKRKKLIENLNYGFDNHASIKYFKKVTNCRSEKKMEDIIFNLYYEIGDVLHLKNYINMENKKYIEPFYKNKNLYKDSKDMIGDISRYLANTSNRLEIRYFFDKFRP